jgi:hypothetical protein
MKQALRHALKSCLAAGLAALLAVGCRSHTTYNHDTNLPREKSGRIFESGFTFRLYPAKNKAIMVDVLDLTPGDYLIEFRLTSAATSGFARCVVKAGEDYGFVITERRYLPDVGAAAWMGECKKKPPAK